MRALLFGGEAEGCYLTQDLSHNGAGKISEIFPKKIKFLDYENSSRLQPCNMNGRARAKKGKNSCLWKTFRCLMNNGFTSNKKADVAYFLGHVARLQRGFSESS